MYIEWGSSAVRVLHMVPQAYLRIINGRADHAAVGAPLWFHDSTVLRKVWGIKRTRTLRAVYMYGPVTEELRMCGWGPYARADRCSCRSTALVLRQHSVKNYMSALLGGWLHVHVAAEHG